VFDTHGDGNWVKYLDSILNNSLEKSFRASPVESLVQSLAANSRRFIACRPKMKFPLLMLLSGFAASEFQAPIKSPVIKR
jgi:hypothetical protein